MIMKCSLKIGLIVSEPQCLMLAREKLKSIPTSCDYVMQKQHYLVQCPHHLKKSRHLLAKEHLLLLAPAPRHNR